MVEIVLTASDQTASKIYTASNIEVKYENFHKCQLFKRYKHKLKTPDQGVIEICNNQIKCLNKLKFDRKEIYKNKKLANVYVYFNKYDNDNQYPLLLVLLFQNEGPKNVENKYWERSKFETKITTDGTQDISLLQEYKNENTILDALLEENDKLKILLTYDIELTLGHLISGFRMVNDNKISVQDDTLTGEPKLTATNFKRYKHTPVNGSGDKKACVIYNKNLLFQSNGQPLYNLQNQNYSYLNVYWSTKVDVPLLLEFNVDTKKRENNEFYYHNVASRLFWEKIDDTNFEKFTSSKISKNDNIYQKLTDHKNYNLFKLLGKVESGVLKILFLFVNKQNGNYGDADVKWTLGNYPRLLESKNRVSVIDILARAEGQCFRNSDFKVYEHDFSGVVNSFPSGQDLKLKFSRSEVEVFSSDNSIIQLDKKISASYNYGSHQITLSYNYNLEHKYKWYRHSCEHKILSGSFKIEFKGEILRLFGDLSDQDISNRIVTVYFKTEYSDRFVLLLFPSTDQNKIRYMTYDVFKKGVIDGSEIKLSTLIPAIVSVMNVDEDDGSGLKIDENLVELLNDEYEKSYSIRIQLDKKNDTYKSGSIKITVNEKDNAPKSGYKCFEHTFNALDTPFELVFKKNGLLKILDVTTFFNGENINKVSVFFHNSKREVPLLIGLTSSKQNRYFKFAEFFYNVSDTVKLTNLVEINEGDIESELDEQWTHLLKDVILDIFETKNYADFNVSLLNPYGNYKYYTHTLTRYFKKIQLKETGLYELIGFRDLNYTYQKPLNVSVFYHAFDQNNLHPLIIEIYSTVRTSENEIINNTLFYHLTNVDNKTFEKTYQKVQILPGQMTNTLDRTYNNFIKKIDGDLKIYELEYTDYILYSRSINKLYVYFHKSDPRPLAFCYDNKAYKRYFLDGTTSKWINIPGVSTCVCTHDNSDLTISSLLKKLSESLCLIKPELSSKKGLETSVELDLSKTETTYGTFNNLTVSSRKQYYHCNLFHYYTHSLTTHSTFKMTSFIRPNGRIKTVNINKPIEDVKSVRVYFNKNANGKPVLLEVIFDNGSKKYLKDLENPKPNYSDSEFTDISDEDKLVDYLIHESDRINERTTFQIDKTATYNSINVSSNPVADKGYTVYTHPKGRTSKHIDVLYNRNLLVGRKNTLVELLNEIEGKMSKDISVYYLNLNNKLPILVFLNTSISSYNSCVLKKDQTGWYWKLEQISYQNSQTTKDKLNETYYFLVKSVVIDLDIQNETSTSYTYDIRLIDNMVGSDGLTPKLSRYRESKTILNSKKIQVSDVTDSCNSLSGTSFKCYEHDLSVLKGIPESTDIGGLRFYIKTPESSNPNEIQVYDSSSKKKRVFLYYNPNESVTTSTDESNKIKVFFHKNDPRPLLISCKGKGYKRVRGENHNEWYNDSSINISGSRILNTLNSIYSDMKKKFIFLKDKNVNDNVNSKTTEIDRSFSKHSYFANDQPRRTDMNFRISKNRLNIQITDGSVIATLFENLYNKYFDSISIYTNKSASSLSDFFLFEFINESSKTHFQKIDNEGKYWVKKSINLSNESKGIQNIQTDITQTIIYDIGNRQTDINPDVSTSESDTTITGFSKYKHTPKKSGHKRSLFYYNQKKITKKVAHGYQELSELESHKYVSVMVYFASKAKKSGTSESVPLMIELTKHTPPNEPDYYVHRKNGTDYYWEKLSGNFLKNLLIQMGFGTSEGNSGYNQLKTILQKAYVTLESKETDISNKISGIKNTQLKNMLVKEVGDSGSSKPTLLKLILQKIDFELVSSVIILLEKNSDDSYGEAAVNNAIFNLHPRRDIIRLSMSNKNISLSEKTNSYGSCVKNYKYRVYEHDFSKLVDGLDGQNQSPVSIRFVIPIKTRGMFSLITFYNGDKNEPENMEYIYYNNTQNQVYVYFYGSDPRPLLLCYGGNAYKPKDKDHYTSTWVKDSNITKCLCQGGIQNNQLLSALTQVMGFLNSVEFNILKLPNPANITMADEPPNSSIYTLDKFTTGVIVKMKITSEKLTCYYKFTYEPDGTNKNGEGFRLGIGLYSSGTSKSVNVYGNSLKGNYDPLSKVRSYFYKYDDKFANPLLVELQFDNDNKEYYKLESVTPNYQWESLESNKVDDESKLLDELFRLNESFNKWNNKKPDKNDCVPSDSTPAIASSTVTLALAGGGTGFAIYKYPEQILSILKKLVRK